MNHSSGRPVALGQRGGRGAGLAACLLAALLATSCAAREQVQHLPAPGALGPYSGAVLAGDLCFASGKIGTLGASFTEEVETAIDAVQAQLGRSGLDLSDVLFATVYLTDMDRYADFNAVYGRRFHAPYPARACVAVAGLPAGARIEIAVVAWRRSP